MSFTTVPATLFMRIAIAAWFAMTFGCESEPPVEDVELVADNANPADKATLFITGSTVLPATENLVYRAIDIQQDAAGRRVEVSGEVIARIAPHFQRRSVELEHVAPAGKTSLGVGAMIADRAGRIDYGTAPELVAGEELIDILPPALTEIRIGQTYETEVAAERYRQMTDADTAYLDEHIFATPITSWQIGESKVVRMDIKAVYTMYWNSGHTGRLESLPGDVSYFGVADLVYAPNHGWRVLRLSKMRRAQTAPAMDPELAHELTLDDVRGVDHWAGVICLGQSTQIADGELRALLADTGGVPEFEVCNR